MASALEKISELEDDLDSYRKSINAQIKSSPERTPKRPARNGKMAKQSRRVYCDVMADYEAEAIVWLDHDNGTEMKRRPMTAEERQYRLPIPRPGDNAPSLAPAEASPAPIPAGDTIGYPPRHQPPHLP